MKIILLSLVSMILSISSYAQTKKQQIAQLNAKSDSLSALLEGNRATIKDLEEQLETKDLQINSCADSLNGERKANIQFQMQYDQLVLDGLTLKAKDHIRSFYDCLELNFIDNTTAYNDGLAFYKTAHKTFLKNATSYSKERVSNLTGPYHDRYQMDLLSIDSVVTTETNITVYTTVEYGLYEGGTFHNMEEIVLIRRGTELIIESWFDIPTKKTLPIYGHYNYTRKQLMKMMGAYPKK